MLFFIRMIGGLPVIKPYSTVGLYLTIFYFIIFLVMLPLISILEKLLFHIYAVEYVQSIRENRLFMQFFLNFKLI